MRTLNSTLRLAGMLLLLVCVIACSEDPAPAVPANAPAPAGNAPEKTSPPKPKEKAHRVPDFGGELRVLSSPPPTWSRNASRYIDWWNAVEPLKRDSTVTIGESDYLLFKVEKQADIALTFLADHSLGARIDQVNLDYADVTETGFQKLATMKRVSVLTVHSCDSTNEACWGALAALPKLKVLTLGRVDKFTKAGLQKVCALKHVQHLRISYNYEITNEWLACMKDAPALTELVFHECLGISRFGFEHLAAISNLKLLELRSCGLVRLEDLNLLLPLEKLESLSICEYSEIDGVGLSILGTLQYLRHLSVQSCGITDAGLTEIAGLGNLRSLDLLGCWLVTDDNVGLLKGMTRLEQLDLRYCKNLSAEAADELKASLPNVTIAHGR